MAGPPLSNGVGFAICVACALLGYLELRDSIKTGVARARGDLYSRDRDPWNYWAYIGLVVIFTVGGFVGAIYTAYRLATGAGPL